MTIGGFANGSPFLKFSSRSSTYHRILMPDPQVLYAITAVVVLGLAAWAITVITRRPDEVTPGVTTLPRNGASGDIAAPTSLARAPLPSPRDDPAPVDKPSTRPTPILPPVLDPGGPEDGEFEVDTDDEEDDQTGPQALILVTAVGKTDPGLKRKHNEDAYVILDDQHVFVIADGMGRHAAGEIASRLAVEAIAEAFNTNNFSKGIIDRNYPRRANQLRAAILLANERILKQATDVDEYHGMGTTVVAASFSQNNQRVFIAHVGDSRCYRVRDAKLKQLTKDHTLGAAGIQGKSSNVLSRAVGIEEHVEVDLTMESPLPGDIYVLCSDGLSRMATDDEILATVTSSRDLDVSSKSLIDLANSRGGRDNITTILVRVDRPDAPPSRPSQKPQI
jgi:serine/threonine protein phosphatase PrpC